MLSTEDLERLITEKRREIEQEKTFLGLSLGNNNVDENNNNIKGVKRVLVSRHRALSESNVPPDADPEEKLPHEDEISPDLERYIRRCVGLPAMLKAGEYSPNNPLIRGERTSGDVLLGLGEYERRRNTLRKIRQRQYKEYLDQQAKKKQEAKEQAERERKEREEKEILREERERERLEQERIDSPVGRRGSVSHTYVSGANNTYIIKVDTGVQVDRRSTPLSVAVQTDDDTLYRTSSPSHNLLTQAERELSPRTVGDLGDGKQLPCESHQWEWRTLDRNHERRRSYGDFDDRMSVTRKPRERLYSELRHSYMPSIFDAEAIRLRNEQAEKEAAERRHSYQQELKNQILEQQKIKEERKNREKMLEAAEMRRLEEQLRSLKMAQERETHRQHDIGTAMNDNATEYERKRTTLQKEIDLEHQALLKAAIHPKRHANTSKSDSPVHTKHSKLPFFYKYDSKPTFSTNIPDNSIFSQNYDVESYLRRNLNPSKESLYSNKIDNKNVVIEKALVHEMPKELRNLNENKESFHEKETRNFSGNTEKDTRDFPENMEKGPKGNIRGKLDNLYGQSRNGRKFSENKSIDTRKYSENVEKLHENFIDSNKLFEKMERNRREEKVFDTLPIPVLRHSPKQKVNYGEKSSELSEKMQIVEDKWKVPVVQKNILKSLPNEKGKNVSILTQLGSIRRQLQLEQLKLDKMLDKNHN
ncbi:calponin homology domain-containing protein DDB_G0272472-like isoform X2 [Maniola hyperantus]|uniref:calponin homology domain-containing protein DDB_G0272472-like isoform X2 n=1 Tax=Aphantopus hyperantus TaxID=2795564 RepID=UPI0015694836|nr:trichohyalin-like [Maniola hyperantus]